MRSLPRPIRLLLVMSVAIVSLVCVSAGARAESTLAPTELVGLLVDPEGRPVSGARVELWVSERLVRSTYAGPDGAFSFSVPPGVVVVQLRAERLGFAPLAIDLTPAADLPAPLRITMVPSPLALPGLRVQVAPERCPQQSHPDGLSLWTRMANRHPDGLDTLGAATYTLVRVDTLSLGPQAAAPLIPESAGDSGGRAEGQRGFSGRLRLAWERRLERDGYAFPIRRSDMEGSYSTWSYAPLEADFSSHFGTARFVSYHRLRAPLPQEDGGWIVPFCPARSDRPGLEGHLELSGDTLLARVEWRFVTGEPDEEAGGWTRFPAVSRASEAPLLLPLESMTWRKIRDGRMQRRAQWYEAWLVTPGDSVPFLPERPTASGPPE